ncbi:MAG: hypothetical protein ACE1Y4_08755 [Lysobacterales bacterium]|nr:hypothetical protein [Gammaproteobacteria bacterium]
MSSLLIRNGAIVTATDHYRADVYIKDEKVTAIAETLDEGIAGIGEGFGKYLPRKPFNPRY